MALLSLESKAMQELCLGCKNVLTIKKAKNICLWGSPGLNQTINYGTKSKKVTST